MKWEKFILPYSDYKTENLVNLQISYFARLYKRALDKIKEGISVGKLDCYQDPD